MSTTMLYRFPGDLLVDGEYYVYKIVPDEEIAQALAEDWFLTMPEAKAAATKVAEPADDAPPTRAELEQKAAELGLKVDGRWSDKKLADKVAEALKV